MVLTFSSYKVLQKNSSAPDFTLPGADGKNYSLEDLKGKKGLLIIFMCNHCPYVQPKMKYFSELRKNYPELQIVGISANDVEQYPEDSFEKMKEYSQKYDFGFPYLFDESQETAKNYGAVCTPDPFLFNENLELVYHGRFDDSPQGSHEEANTSEMEDAIKQLLAGEEITVETKPSQGCNIKWSE